VCGVLGVNGLSGSIAPVDGDAPCPVRAVSACHTTAPKPQPSDCNQARRSNSGGGNDIKADSRSGSGRGKGDYRPSPGDLRG
jgi:hypothetical protein